MNYTIGPVTLDYIVTASGALHEALLGGGAAYSAAGCRVWTEEVAIISSVDPSFPQAALDELADAGIPFHNVDTNSETPAPHSFFSYQQVNNQEDIRATTKYIELDRAIPKELLAKANSKGDNLPQPVRFAAPEKLPAAMSEAHAVHISSVDADTAQLIGGYLQSLRIPIVSFDPHPAMMDRDQIDALKMTLQDVDLFSPSERQCREFFRPERPTIWEMAEAFAEMGPEIVVIKRGERGQALLDCQNQERWHIPAYPTQPVDVTGAGHVYSGAFLAAYAEDEGNALYAAACGGAAASLAIEGVGWSYPLDAMPGLPQARRDRILQGVQPA